MAKTKWYNNSIKESLISETDAIPEGYVKGRLPKHTRLDDLILMVSKEELYDLYIIQNIPFHKLYEQLNISDRDLRKLLTHYKIKKDLKQAAKNNQYKATHEDYVERGKKSASTQKKNWESKSDAEKHEWVKTCRDAQLNMSAEKKKKKTDGYLNWWFSLTEEQRREINLKRSNTVKQNWEENGDVILQKMKITEKENRKDRLCRSVAEQKMFDVLIKKYPDVIYDIRVDDRYPFYVDFYVPSEDLFIELNAHPSHGRLPMHLLKFEEYSKYTSKWADVFGRRDVEKQNCALMNNLNYIMIYPQATLNENISLNNQNKNLIELLYNSQK